MPSESMEFVTEKNIQKRKWINFLFISFGLIAGGIACIFLPTISEFAASTVFGFVLIAIGLTKIIQSLWVKSWTGFVWQEMSGAVEFVGGVMIYINPLKGALAIALLIAVILFVHGCLQVAMSLKLRPEQGWYWFFLSGVIALAASGVLFIKWPLTKDLPAGVIAGIALLIAGIAYLGCAMSTRRA